MPARSATLAGCPLSTISARCVQDIGAEAAALGVAVLDCGVTGGPAAAASGDLVCMVGGDPAVIERAAPLFAAVSSHPEWLPGWTRYGGTGVHASNATNAFDPLAFGACASILLALISQTAEQVDYLRFLPPRAQARVASSE